MQEDEQKQLRDDARCDVTVQTMKDMLWRFDEMSEGSYSLYDVLGYVVEDVIREGSCAACIHESLAAVYKDLAVDPGVHRGDGDGDAIYH